MDTLSIYVGILIGYAIGVIFTTYLFLRDEDEWGMKYDY